MICALIAVLASAASLKKHELESDTADVIELHVLSHDERERNKATNPQQPFEEEGKAKQLRRVL